MRGQGRSLERSRSGDGLGDGFGLGFKGELCNSHLKEKPRKTVLFPEPPLHGPAPLRPRKCRASKPLRCQPAPLSFNSWKPEGTQE